MGTSSCQGVWVFITFRQERVGGLGGGRTSSTDAVVEALCAETMQHSYSRNTCLRANVRQSEENEPSAEWCAKAQCVFFFFLFFLPLIC